MLLKAKNMKKKVKLPNGPPSFPPLPPLYIGLLGVNNSTGFLGTQHRSRRKYPEPGGTHILNPLTKNIRRRY